MNTAYLLSALALGFLGSFHCVGMCGPIALALPGGRHGTGYKIAGRLLYNAGRTVTYSVMGLAAGLVGYSAALQGLQSELSVLTGVLIIVGVLFGRKIVAAGPARFLSGLTARFKRRFAGYFGSGSRSASFMIGILNGFLPCGFVYIALAGAMAAGHYAGSTAYMALFGLGTLPAMLFVGLAGQWLGMRFGGFFRKASPVIAIMLALLLIYRGDTLTRKGRCGHDMPVAEKSGSLPGGN